MAAWINSDARDQFVRDCASILSKITLENAQKLLSYVSQHIQDIWKLPSDEQADAIWKLTGNILAMFGTLGAVRVARAGKSIAWSGKVLAQSGVQSIQQPGARILGATQIVSGSTGVVAGKTAQVAAISVGTLWLHPSGNVTLQGGKQATKIVTQPHPNTATLQNTVPSAVSKTPSGHHILQNTNNVTPTRSPNTNSQPQKTHTSDTIHQNPSQDLHNQGLPVVPNKPQTPHLVDPSLSVHQEYLNKIDTKTQVRLQEMYASALQQNKWKLITNDTIVGVPMYAGEKNFHFIDALLAQKWAAFKTVIFVNAPKTGTSAISAKEFQQKIVNLNTYIKSHAWNKSDQFIILTQHYETRVWMWTIRGDMVDSIALSLDPKVKKPVFVWIDADTWKLSDNYVASNRDKFNTTDVSYTTGSLRWTDPEKHNYTWLSEMLFQSTYRPFFVKNWKFPHAAGWSTSFRIDRYMEVGWYDRSILAGQAWEDARLWVSFAKNNMQWTPIGTKVYVDPRRGEQALQQWKKFGNQWHDIFNPVDSNSLNNQIYTESDRIVSLLRTGKTLKEDELDAIVSKINDHLDDGYFNDPSRMYNPDVVRKRFIRFWNMNVTDSLYQAGQKDWKFIFIKKSS